MSKIKIITRGDDAASSRSANFAIRESFEKGILRNCSVLACAGFTEHAFEVLGGMKGLCFGLHASIACEWKNPRWKAVLPPSELPGLTDNSGFLLKTPNEVNDKGVPVEIIMKEISAQLDKLTRLGFNITYLDTHMGFSWIAGVKEALLEFCSKKGLIQGFSGYKTLPKTGNCNDLIEAFIQSAKIAKPGTYLLVGHPCYDDEEFAGFILWDGEAQGPTRDRQRILFLDPRVLELVSEGLVKPIRYDEL